MGLLNKLSVMKTLRRCALCFAVVQMGKAVREAGIGNDVAKRLKGSLHAARRRIRARKRREAKLKELKEQLEKGNNRGSMHDLLAAAGGGPADTGKVDTTAAAAIAAAAADKGGGGREDKEQTNQQQQQQQHEKKKKKISFSSSSTSRRKDDDDGKNSTDSDEWVAVVHERKGGVEAEDEEYAANALDEVALALAMEGDGAASERVAAMAIRGGGYWVTRVTGPLFTTRHSYKTAPRRLLISAPFQRRLSQPMYDLSDRICTAPRVMFYATAKRPLKL